MAKMGVIGTGAWGTALAQMMASNGHDVIMVGPDETAISDINDNNRNEAYLPDQPLSASITASNDWEALRGSEAVLYVAPTQIIPDLIPHFDAHVDPNVPLIFCCKGLIRKTRQLPTQYMDDHAPSHETAVLSGPSFAHDVAAGLPTAVTLGADTVEKAVYLAHWIGTESFRLYASDDKLGVQFGGALKNVLAIACGMAIGRGLGESAKAALIARGFAELRRFACHYGAKDETLMGLSGLGDLVLTASTSQSRNFALGEALGQGAPLPSKLAEGAFTASVVVEKVEAEGIEMPIATAVHHVLTEAITIEEAINGLLSRSLKVEEE